jgi:hypothetical protein
MSLNESEMYCQPTRRGHSGRPPHSQRFSRKSIGRKPGRDFGEAHGRRLVERLTSGEIDVDDLFNPRRQK